MKQFEYFDHTADTLFRAYGKNFEEALKNTILAVYNVIVDTKTISPKKEKSFTIIANKKETLIYDLIDELLFYQDTEGFLGCSIKKFLLTNEESKITLQVALLGDNADKYDVFGHIKSPTYNEMLINEEKDNVFIQAVLDL